MVKDTRREGKDGESYTGAHRAGAEKTGKYLGDPKRLAKVQAVIKKYGRGDRDA